METQQRVEYFIRQVGYTSEITKFVDGEKEPSTTYRIRPKLSCTCLSREKNCKHHRMLESGFHCFIDGDPIKMVWENLE